MPGLSKTLLISAAISVTSSLGIPACSNEAPGAKTLEINRRAAGSLSKLAAGNGFTLSELWGVSLRSASVSGLRRAGDVCITPAHRHGNL